MIRSINISNGNRNLTAVTRLDDPLGESHEVEETAKPEGTTFSGEKVDAGGA